MSIGMINLKGNRGYTLLFAVLTASLVLGVAAFIVGFSRKQFLLAAGARDSMFAIYAANSGIECAALNYQISSLSSSSPGTLSCGGQTYGTVPLQNASYYPETLSSSPTPYGWQYAGIDQSNGRCAVVTFYTGLSKNGNIPSTVIESRGYNLCKNSGGNLGPDTSNPRILERAIRVRYLGEW